MEFVLFYATTTLMVVSLLFIWFKTSFPCLIFGTLHKLGFKKKVKDFWELGLGEDFSPYDWTENELELFYATKLGLLGHLLSCRYCLSCHLILWVNILFALFLLPFGISFPIWFIAGVIGTQFPIVHLIYSFQEKHNLI
jgi:uncharacterized membrane protein